MGIAQIPIFHCTSIFLILISHLHIFLPLRSNQTGPKQTDPILVELCRLAPWLVSWLLVAIKILECCTLIASWLFQVTKNFWQDEKANTVVCNQQVGFPLQLTLSTASPWLVVTIIRKLTESWSIDARFTGSVRILVKSCSSKHHFCRKRFQWLWNCGKPHVT